MIPAPAAVSASIQKQLLAAREAARQRKFREAEALYAAVLHAMPNHAEALAYLGSRALRRGEHVRALALLERATGLDGKNAEVHEGIGIARLRGGDVSGAKQALGRALALTPGRHIARLFLGLIHELLGDQPGAAREYVRAVEHAQRRNLWVSRESTPPWLMSEVPQAIAVARQHRRGLIEGALDPVRARHGRDALRRVERCAAMYLGDTPKIRPDPRQQPKALYLPDLPTAPYFDRSLFDWIPGLEECAAGIREELKVQVASTPGGFEPFLHFGERTKVDQYLRSSGEQSPAWDAFFFYRHGARREDNCTSCPRTAQALEALPLVRIRDHSPEICFSLLAPGTHIMPHHGDTNTRVVAHLPLVVPRDCALEVGGEVHAWQEGQVVVFDDTFLHQAWNRSDQTRVLLILDAWNPHLALPEREALTAMVEVLGDFDRECKAVAPAPAESKDARAPDGEG